MNHSQIMKAAVEVAAWSETELAAVLELAKILRTCELPPKRKYTRRQAETVSEALGYVPREDSTGAAVARRQRKPKPEPLPENVTVRMPEID